MYRTGSVTQNETSSQVLDLSLSSYKSISEEFIEILDELETIKTSKFKALNYFMKFRKYLECTDLIC